MNLRRQAAADLRVILEDAAAGFGWPITVTDPSGTAVELTGFTADIGETIDPETGQLVSGRKASVAIAIESLRNAGLGLPRGIADGSSKPWRVSFDSEVYPLLTNAGTKILTESGEEITTGGIAHEFKISEVLPDRTAGVVVCFLEAYKP